MSKNSINKPLKGFTWKYTGKISTSKGTGFQGKGVSRTLFLHPSADALKDIPAEMFMIKLSQSPDATKNGKPVFRFLTFRPGAEGKFVNLAPADLTLETPLEEIKNRIVAQFANIPDITVSFNIPLKGTFTNLQTATMLITLYDANNEELKTNDPLTSGDAPYYIKQDAVITVQLKGAESQGNEYFQSTLSTDATPEEVLVTRQVGQIWDGASNGTSTSDVASAAVGTGNIWG